MNRKENNSIFLRALYFVKENSPKDILSCERDRIPSWISNSVCMHSINLNEVEILGLAVPSLNQFFFHGKHFFRKDLKKTSCKIGWKSGPVSLLFKGGGDMMASKMVIASIGRRLFPLLLSFTLLWLLLASSNGFW